MTGNELQHIAEETKLRCVKKIEKFWLKYRPTPRSERLNLPPFDPFNIAAFDKDEIEEILRKEKSKISIAPLYSTEGSTPKTSEKDQLSFEDYHIYRQRTYNRIKILSQQMRGSTETKMSRKELLLCFVDIHNKVKLRARKSIDKNIRREKLLATQKLLSTCSDRITALTSPFFDIAEPTDAEISKAFTAKLRELRDECSNFSDWDLKRKFVAYRSHMKAYNSFSLTRDDRKWYHTTVAGEEVDVRKYLITKNSFDQEQSIFSWQRKGIEKLSEHQAEVDVEPEESWTPVDVNMYSIYSYMCPELIVKKSDGIPGHKILFKTDHESSEWWKAHCKCQYYRDVQQYNATPSACIGKYLAKDEIVTAEMVANPDLYDLYKESLLSQKRRNVQMYIRDERSRFDQSLYKCVQEIKAAVQWNMEHNRRVAQHQSEQLQGRSRQELAALVIQRYYRGHLARKLAKNLFAEYYVLVRGRAIRNGKCEECGEHPAVLQCYECDVCSHFCPNCWVHVHQTRRRKQHVAIPMSKPSLSNVTGVL